MCMLCEVVAENRRIRIVVRPREYVYGKEVIKQALDLSLCAAPNAERPLKSVCV